MEKEKQEKLIEMVESFCDEYLDDEYKELSRKLVEKMGRKHNVPFKRGKLEIWASAVIYALGQINFLFDKSFEPYITRKDICDYFGTKQSTVSNKAQKIREMFNLTHFDKNFSVQSMQAPKLIINEDGFILPDSQEDLEINELIQEFVELFMEDNSIEDLLDDLDNDLNDEENEMSIEDYQDKIDEFKEAVGEEYFEENEGHFWAIPETREFMQCLLDHSQLLWLDDQKDEALDELKYMLKLNPNDNQGVRYSLFTYLLELNRLKEAKKVYLEYEDEYSAFWLYNKLLLDIKNNESLDILKEDYDECLECNKHVTNILLGEKEIREVPDFYSPGDEGEATFYILLAADAWCDDEKALTVLYDLSES